MCLFFNKSQHQENYIFKSLSHSYLHWGIAVPLNYSVYSFKRGEPVFIPCWLGTAKYDTLVEQLL